MKTFKEFVPFYISERRKSLFTTNEGWGGDLWPRFVPISMIKQLLTSSVTCTWRQPGEPPTFSITRRDSVNFCETTPSCVVPLAEKLRQRKNQFSLHPWGRTYRNWLKAADTRTKKEERSCSRAPPLPLFTTPHNNNPSQNKFSEGKRYLWSCCICYSF